MHARAVVGLAALLIVTACSPSLGVTASSTPPPSPSAPVPPAATSSTPSPVVSSGSATSPSSPSPATSSSALTVCPTPIDGATCPLPPGEYTARVHDPFTLLIDDDGWQEEPAAAGEFETRVVLSRADAPEQRLTFLSGQTGPAERPLPDMGSIQIPGFAIERPIDVEVSGASGQSVEIEPTGTEGGVLDIEGQAIELKPDRRYQLTITRVPMGEESATLIAVAESPLDEYEAFVEMAAKLVLSLDF
jgi:hypothetical protein